MRRRERTNLFTRMMSLITALCMSFVMMGITSMTAFAADEDAPLVFETSSGSTRSVGDILAVESDDFVTTVTIPVYLSKGNWSADFLVKITGNAGAQYQVDLTTPGGNTISQYIYSNSGSYTNMVTMTYASAGTYYFKFTRITGSANTVHAICEICD